MSQDDERRETSREARIETVTPASPGARLELFARKARPGWITSGSEIPVAVAKDSHLLPGEKIDFRKPARR